MVPCPPFLTTSAPRTCRCSPDSDQDAVQGWLLPDLDTVGSIYSISNGTCWTVLGWGGGTCDGGCVSLGDCEGPLSTQFYRGSAAENASSSFFTIAAGPSWLNDPTYENTTLCVQENHAGRYLQVWPCSGSGDSPGEGWEVILAPSGTSSQLETDGELHFDPRRRCGGADFPCPASASPSPSPSPTPSPGTSVSPTRTVTRTRSRTPSLSSSPAPGGAAGASPAGGGGFSPVAAGGLSVFLILAVASGAVWVLRFDGDAVLRGAWGRLTGGGGGGGGTPGRGGSPSPRAGFLSATAGGAGSSGAAAAVARLNFAATAAPPPGAEKVSLLRGATSAPTYGASGAI